ncbi:hypothetical protein B9Z65_8232 [Elsinoe australis]|uniref:Uncharacterized protein n=1 Tax=Elsinoe australis TaxID=40998 RepID=A0A2P7ZMJ5_9PEZI|nr:hypothetical protein B9Z65_8232 [Elsinoe australis]
MKFITLAAFTTALALASAQSSSGGSSNYGPSSPAGNPYNTGGGRGLPPIGPPQAGRSQYFYGDGQTRSPGMSSGSGSSQSGSPQAAPYYAAPRYDGSQGGSSAPPPYEAQRGGSNSLGQRPVDGRPSSYPGASGSGSGGQNRQGQSGSQSAPAGRPRKVRRDFDA